MTNTTRATNPRNAGAEASINVRVLYNDAIVNRQSEAEESLPGRMSEIDDELRKSGAVMPAFSRMLSGDSCYHPGDPLIEVYQVEIAVNPMAMEIDAKRTAHQMCERMFSILNAHYPEGWSRRSMCIGDIVIVGETAWSCESVRFEPVDISDSEILVAS